jgi:hypothetical protein
MMQLARFFRDVPPAAVALETVHWRFAEALAAQKDAVPQCRHVEAKQELKYFSAFRPFFI